MLKIRNYLLIIISLLTSVITYAQCDYNLVNYSHIDCFGDNTGVIDITVLNSNATFWWDGPNGFTSNSSNLTNLFAGKYTLTIVENVVPGDTTTTVVCVLIDTVTIYETIPISANFELYNMCSEDDSADVSTTIWGGTPPYSTLWSTGDTSRNTTNLAPNIFIPYILTITDANFCVSDQNLVVPIVSEMNTFMSSVGEICKDDNSGSARVFVTNGTSPYSFSWDILPDVIIEHDSFSSIESLFPGEYIVNIIDDMGCTTSDTVEIKVNPKECITIYKAFSPNDDDVNEFWIIENIHLYPLALVTVYDRNGREVYRRRNYINAENEAFSGKDKSFRNLPSGTYYYLIDLENGDEMIKGTITIVR